jgi:hypothetical protein
VDAVDVGADEVDAVDVGAEEVWAADVWAFEQPVSTRATAIRTSSESPRNFIIFYLLFS